MCLHVAVKLYEVVQILGAIICPMTKVNLCCTADNYRKLCRTQCCMKQVAQLAAFPRYLTLFRAGSERFDSGRGGGGLFGPPSDLENQASERQAANGVG